jgi:hypothetical protein
MRCCDQCAAVIVDSCQRWSELLVVAWSIYLFIIITSAQLRIMPACVPVHASMRGRYSGTSADVRHGRGQHDLHPQVWLRGGGHVLVVVALAPAKDYVC